MHSRELLPRKRARTWRAAALVVIACFVLLVHQFPLYHIPIDLDAGAYFAPYYMLVAEHIRQGQLLLWDPWNSFGLPVMADPQVGTFSPVTLLFGAITGASTLGFMVYWFSIWLLGGIGMLMLGRHLRAPAWGSATIAIGMLVCGVYLGQFDHVSHAISFSFIPWILWRLDAGLVRRNLLALAQAGALLALSGLGGYPGMTVYTGLYCICWAGGRLLWMWAGRRSGTAFVKDLRGLAWRSVLAIGVAVAGSLPGVIPMLYEARGNTDRVSAMDMAVAIGQGNFFPEGLASLVSPLAATQLAMSHPGRTRTHGMCYDIYAGGFTVAFALSALVLRPKSLWRWLLLVVGIAFLITAMGDATPLRKWVYLAVPPTRYFKYPAIFRDYWIITCMVLGLLGTRDLAELWQRRPRAALLLFGGISLLLFAAGVALHWLPLHDVPMPSPSVMAFGWVALAATGAAGLLALVVAWRGMHPLMIVGMLLLLGGVNAYATMQTRVARLPFLQDPARRAIWAELDSRYSGDLRLVGQGLAREAIYSPRNEALITKRPTLFGYTPMALQFEAARYGPATRQELIDTFRFAAGAERMWFSATPVECAPSSAAYRQLAKLTRSGYPPLLLHSREQMFDRPPQAPPAALAQAPRMQPLSVKLIHYRPTRLSFDVTAPADGWLLVTDRWSRSWEATVNGNPVEVRGGNLLFRAIKIPAGRLHVDFRYRTGWIWWCVGPAWGVLATVLLATLWTRRRSGAGQDGWPQCVSRHGRVSARGGGHRTAQDLGGRSPAAGPSGGVAAEAVAVGHASGRGSAGASGLLPR